MNGEDAGGWNVVGGTVSSVVLPVIPGENRFYLQSSFDGINWSDSAISTYFKKDSSRMPLDYALRISFSPFSSADYYFYNGHQINEARTLMGTIYGLSGDIEGDFTVGNALRLYADIGYSMVVKIQTVLPKERAVHYFKFGAGADWVNPAGYSGDVYLGLFGGGLVHINNREYTLTPYYGLRGGYEYSLTEHLTIGAMIRVSAAILNADESIYDSLTLLVDPLNLTISYTF